MLFVIAALLPMTIAAYLSYESASSVLTAQAKSQLRQTGKALGVSIQERLQTAGHLLLDLARTRPSPEGQPDRIGSQMFASLSVFEFGAAVGAPISSITDHDGLVDLTQAEREHLEMGQPLLISRHDTQNTTLYLLALSADRRTAWQAKLAEDFVFGDLNDLPGNHQLCVLQFGAHPVFCSSDALYKMLHAGSRTVIEDVEGGGYSWQQADAVYAGESSEIFLAPQFGHSSWTVVVGMPIGAVLEQVNEYRVMFLPLFVGALLAAILMSFLLIRRRMVPLDRLADYARLVSQKKFDAPLNVETGDEFEGLANSLRSMSRGLAHQFSIIDTMSEIDRKILSSPEPGAVAEIVLSRMPEIIPSENAAITVLDRSAPDMAQSFLSLMGGGKITTERTTLVKDISRLFKHAHGGLLLGAEDAPKYARPLIEDGARHLFSTPIIKGSHIYGVLTLGYSALPDLSVDLMHQASELCARLAVAMATVERDEQLYHQAHFDSLTGLANRQLFSQRMEMEIRRSERDRSSMGLLFIDLDNFKIINDVRGHSAGDELIRKVGARLRERVRESDLIARLGGDEFTVLLPALDNTEDAGRVAKDILDSLQQPFSIDGGQHFISASIGVTLFPGDGRTVEALLRNADTAMYRAKAAGRDRYMFFQEEMNKAAVRRAGLESQLRTIVETQGIKVHFQPLLDARTNEVVAAEALMRWPIQSDGGADPDEFIPVAEETGLIVPMGYAVLDEACRAMAEWHAEGIALARIAANVSPRQFSEPGFVDEVLSILACHQLKPDSLELEITESLLLEEVPRIRMVLEELCRHGIRLSIDDFGTGYSALGYLRRYPVQTIKIDRSFVSELDHDDSAQKLTRAIIAMSHGLGKRVVAEGVETQAQLDILSAQGCDVVQGHLFSHAMPARSFASYARQQDGRVMMKALMQHDAS